MTHMTYGGPVYDAHIHMMGGTGAISYVNEMGRQNGYDRMNMLSLEAYRPGQNALCFLWKDKTPGGTLFAGLNHRDGDLRAQAERLIALGADGFKLIEGKPDVYAKLQKPLNSPDYDGFYRYAERHGIPVLLHVGDPPEFWNPEKAPAFARENGWLYTGKAYPPLERLREETEDIAARYPGLTLIIAHFYFLGHDLDAAERFLAAHPAVRFDITPGVEMFTHFAARPDEWQDFFLRFEDRIIFGTDNFDVDSSKDRADKEEINKLLHCFLQTDGPYQIWDLELRGLGLPPDTLRKIYHDNFAGLLPSGPRPADGAGIARYCAGQIERARTLGLSEQDRLMIGQIARHFETPVMEYNGMSILCHEIDHTKKEGKDGCPKNRSGLRAREGKATK